MNMTDVIEPGKLRYRVSIHNPPDLDRRDEYGQPYDPQAAQPILADRVPAEVEWSLGGEAGGSSTKGALVKIRYRDDVGPTHWLECDGERLEIQSIILPSQKHHCMILKCSAVAGAL